ncbi:hypothetical protein ACFL1H_05645 [Nanoarchaeota archaeon]
MNNPKQPKIEKDLHVFVGYRRLYLLHSHNGKIIDKRSDLIIGKSLEEAINETLEEDENVACKLGIIRNKFLADTTQPIENLFPDFNFYVRNVTGCYGRERSEYGIYSSERVFPDITVARSFEEAEENLGINNVARSGGIHGEQKYDYYIEKKE